MLRPASVIALAGLAVCLSAETSAARHLKRHHAHSRLHRQFVFPTPEDAARAVDTGQFAGDFVTGIPGATTADPYEHPVYGYDQRGVSGPGYAYPGY